MGLAIDSLSKAFGFVSEDFSKKYIYFLKVNLVILFLFGVLAVVFSLPLVFKAMEAPNYFGQNAFSSLSYLSAFLTTFVQFSLLLSLSYIVVSGVFNAKLMEFVHLYVEGKKEPPIFSDLLPLGIKWIKSAIASVFILFINAIILIGIFGILFIFVFSQMRAGIGLGTYFVIFLILLGYLLILLPSSVMCSLFLPEYVAANSSFFNGLGNVFKMVKKNILSSIGFLILLILISLIYFFVYLVVNGYISGTISLFFEPSLSSVHLLSRMVINVLISTVLILPLSILSASAYYFFWKNLREKEFGSVKKEQKKRSAKPMTKNEKISSNKKSLPSVKKGIKGKNKPKK